VYVIADVSPEVDEAVDELPPQPRKVSAPGAESSRSIIFLPDMSDLVY
jgi:hypothetical protein